MLHVLPVNDCVGHTLDTVCECGVDVEFVEGEIIVTHNSEHENDGWVVVDKDTKEVL